MHFRRQLNLLRILAIGLVLLYHLLPDVFPLGYLGVDIFIILSGYLILPKLEAHISSSNFSLRNFLYERLIRLYPALYFALITSLSYFYFTLLPDAFYDYAQSIFATVFLSSNVLFSMEAGDYFANNTSLKPLSHMWSLSLEEQFYLLFGILGLVAHQFRKSNIFFLLLLLSFLTSLLAFLFASDGVLRFYLLPFRIWEFAYGYFLFKIYNKYTCGVNVYPGISFFTVIIVGYLVTSMSGVFSDYIFFLVVILVSALFLTNISITKYGKVIDVFSSLTYPMYIWHQLIIAATKNDPHLVNFNAITIFSLSLLLSVITRYIVEIPIQKKFKSQFKLQFVISYFALSLVLAGFSSMIMVSKGLPGRMPEISNTVLEMRALKQQYHSDYSLFLNSSGSFDITFPENGKKNVVVLGDSWGFDIANGLAITDKYNVAFPKRISHVCIELTGSQQNNSILSVAQDETSCDQNLDLLKYIPKSVDRVIIANSQYSLNQYDREIDSLSLKKLLTALDQRDLLERVVVIKGRPIWKASGMSIDAKFDNLSNNSVFLKSFLFYDVGQMQNINKYYKDYYENLGVRVAFLTDALCNEESCRLYSDDEKLIYFDTNHLTMDGARIVGNWFHDYME